MAFRAIPYGGLPSVRYVFIYPVAVATGTGSGLDDFALTLVVKCL